MKAKILWMVEWNNGEDYEDNRDDFVGIFSTEEKARTAGEMYHNNALKNGNTYNPAKADFYVYEVELNKMGG